MRIFPCVNPFQHDFRHIERIAIVMALLTVL